jgi:hypothetical protein
VSGNANSGYRPPSRWEPCGTAAAYRRHVRRKEPTDQACKDAHAAEERWRQRGLAVAAVLRRAHADVKALRRGGQAVPSALAQMERTYQRLAKRRQRTTRAAAMTGTSWCASQSRSAAGRAA